MSKSSKLLKLLSASAIVAGGNFYALADCELCKGHDHEVTADKPCPNFDYAGFAKEIGEYISAFDSSDKWRLTERAKQNPWSAEKYITTPRSTVISFKTSTGNTQTPSSMEGTTISKSNTREMLRQESSVIPFETPTGNTSTPSGMKSTTNSESDTREMRRQERLQAKAKEREEYREKRRQQHSQNRNSNTEAEVVANRIVNRAFSKAAAEVHEDLGHRATDLQNLFDENKAREEEDRMAERKARMARERDTRVLNDMMKERVTREPKREVKSIVIMPEGGVADLEEKLQGRKLEEAHQTARENQEKLKMSDEEKRQSQEQTEMREVERLRKKSDRKRDSEQLQAMKIQSAFRRHLERKKAAKLKENQQAAAEKQAKYNVEEVQIETPHQLTEQPQEEHNTEEAPTPAGYTEGGEIAQRLQQEEEERIARENFTAEAQRTEETLTATARQEATLSADDEVENDRWSLPESTASSFKGYNHRDEECLEQANRWAYKWLKNLSIRKIEYIFFVVSNQYCHLQRVGLYAKSARVAEALFNVENIFPYGGTNAGVLNVYKAMTNVYPSSFSEEVHNSLRRDELDGILYQVASRYMQLLNEGRKAASKDFVELAKAIFEYFNEDWKAEDIQFVPENEDFRPAPREQLNVKELAGEAAKADKGIDETEAAENSTWNPPYRVYYSYCENLKHGLRPSSKSMKRFQDKTNREQLYRNELEKLSIRRLEALIWYAARLYKPQNAKYSHELNRIIEDVVNVFARDKQEKLNAREANAFHALGNMVDKPNDNPHSMQPFQKGFEALTPEEQEYAFTDMAREYHQKLYEGKRPSNMAFVNFANEVLRIFAVEVFANGENNVKPILKFEEFENNAEPAVTPKNDNRESAITVGDREELNHSMADRDIISESEPQEEQDWNLPSNPKNSSSFLKELEGLSIRRLEIVMYLAACQYGCRDRSELRGTARGWEIAKRMRDDLFNGSRDEKNLRLFNAFLALQHQQALKKKFRGYRGDGCYYYEDAFQGRFRRLQTGEAEIVLGMISQAYRTKLRDDHKPSHPLFVEFADQMCKQLSLDGWLGEVEDPAYKHPEYPEFNNAATPSGRSNKSNVTSRRNVLEDSNGGLVTAGE